MSDEWIEGRSLRTRPAQPEPEPPPPDYPSFVPRFVTETGDLKPLTDETIAEIEELVAAYSRGETPAGYQPEIETPDGERHPINRQTLSDLAAIAERRKAGREASKDQKADSDSGAEEVRATAEDRAVPPDFVPWFDTVTGELPPVVIDEEGEASFQEAADVNSNDVVDAEWVIAVGEKLEGDHPLAKPGRPVGPITMQLMQAIREGRLGPEDDFRKLGQRRVKPWQIAVGLAVIFIGSILIFAPIDLASLVDSGSPTAPTKQPTEATDTLKSPTQPVVAADPATNTPVVIPTPTPIPVNAGRLVFASSRDGDFDLYLLDMVSGELRTLTDNDDDDRMPVWSPDGQRVLYVSNEAGDDDLYLLDLSGGDPVQLTTSTASDRSPAWSPDGSNVVFSRERVTGAELLRIPVTCMDEPGACEDVVSEITTGRYDLDPTWSPDGSRVAFGAADFPGQPATLAVISVVEDTFRTLEGTGTADFDPAWNPDGSWLTFVSNRFEDYDLWVTPPDGSQVVQLTRSTGSDVQPAWSPYGAWIVFASDRDGNFDLYAIRTECAIGLSLEEPATCEDEVVRITTDPADDLDPAWGP